MTPENYPDHSIVFNVIAVIGCVGYVLGRLLMGFVRYFGSWLSLGLDIGTGHLPLEDISPRILRLLNPIAFIQFLQKVFKGAFTPNRNTFGAGVVTLIIVAVATLVILLS